MAKTKSARLSLTMPTPVQLSHNHALSPTSNGHARSGSTDYLMRDRNDYIGPIGDQVLQDTREVERPRTPSRPAKNSERSASNQQGPPASPKSPTSPTFTSLPPFPTSPGEAPKHVRDPSKSFFANLKASKSSAKIQPPENTIRKVSDDNFEDVTQSGKNKSTPDLATTAREAVPDLPTLDSSAHHTPANTEHVIRRRPVGLSNGSTTNLSNPQPEPLDPRRKENSIFSNLMKRNQSGRVDEVRYDSGSKPSTPTQSRAPDTLAVRAASRDRSVTRNASPHSDSEDHRAQAPKSTRSEGSQLSSQRSQMFREGGTHLFSGFKEKTAKAAGTMGNAGIRFFRGGKSGVGNIGQGGQGPPQPHLSPQKYVCHVINLPLREQTRQTRISKRLEDSKDKTEFWMPSLPWRCIDYLNFKGCETEGLYRVPGSDLQIKLWKQRFDTESDINLFDEEELYDVNIIGSLFKAWLRDLPDEIFPKSTQDRITDECKDEKEAPQLLKDELSRLPPWNYYLLFAITCHLSLLHAYADLNKMTFHNLTICFAPALGMNGDCFRWLVTDWRSCWQGCWTEKAALEDEYRIIDSLDNPATEASPTDLHLDLTHEPDRAPSSSGSGRSNLRPPPLAVSQSDDQSTLHAQGGSHHGRSASQLPELTLPQPISPIFATHHVQP